MRRCIVLLILLMRIGRCHDRNRDCNRPSLNPCFYPGSPEKLVSMPLHRRTHTTCAPSSPHLALSEAGKVASSTEQLLLAAVKTEATLTDNENPRLRDGVALLRSTAGS